MEHFDSLANQRASLPEQVLEPISLNAGEDLTLAVPVDGPDGNPDYFPLVGKADTKGQLGVELPTVMHIEVGGAPGVPGVQLAVIDLRGAKRSPTSGARHVQTFGMDHLGRTTDSSHITRWDADFLVVGKAWNDQRYGRGARGYLGIRPPERTVGEELTEVSFGAESSKCRSRFDLPPGMPQDAFHISYDGTNLKVTAASPVTVTRVVEKTPNTEPTDHELTGALAGDEASTVAASIVSNDSVPRSAHTLPDGSQAPNEGLVVSDAPSAADEMSASGSLALTETEPNPQVVPELNRPTAAEIFASAESFAQTLDDQQLDPALRSQLFTLQEAWRGVQAAAEGNQFWYEAVRGNLFELTETLSTMRYQGRELEDAIEEAQHGLSHLQSAIYDGRYDDVAAVLQRYQFTGSLENMRYRIGQLDQMGLDMLDNRLHWHALETDERYMRMRRGAGEMNEGSTEQMVAEFRDRLVQTNDLQRLAADYAEEHGYEMARWQRRRDALETLAEFSHKTGNQVLEIQISRAKYAWDEAFDRLSGALTSGNRTDDSEVGYVRSLLNQPLEEVQFFRRLAQLAELATEEAN